MRKGSVHLESTRQPAPFQRQVKFRVELPSPLGTADHRLVFRESFRKPPRDVAVGELDGENVSQLVPEYVAPVERFAVGAHRRHYLPEAHALNADIGQPAGANAEMLPFGVHLDDRGGARDEHVVDFHRCPRLCEHSRDVALENRFFAPRVPDVEDTIPGALVLLRDPLPIKELERVVHAYVEVVFLPGAFERGHSRGLVPRARLHHAKLSPRLAVARVDDHGVVHHRDDVCVAVFPLRVLRNDSVRLAELFVSREHFLLRFFESRAVVREKARCSPKAQELEVVRVDG